MTLGSFLTFTVFLAFLVAPVFQIVAIGHADHRSARRASSARAKC